jgi:hypothetical protein
LNPRTVHFSTVANTPDSSGGLAAGWCRGFTDPGEVGMMRDGNTMANYILLYRIRKVVKKLLKEKIADDELATTAKSCLGCLADDISWEIHDLIKEKYSDD